MLWRVSVPIGLGMIFAFLLEKPTYWLISRLRISGRRGRAAISLLMILLVSTVVLLPLTLAIYSASKQLVQLSSSINENHDVMQMLIQQGQFLKSKLASIHFLPSSFLEQLSNRLGSLFFSFTNFLLQKGGALLAATPQAVLAMMIFFLSWFTCLTAGPKVRHDVLEQLIPFPKERVLIMDTTEKVIFGLIFANILVAFIQALLSTFFLFIFKIPHFFLLGILTLFAAFIPAIGTALITGSAAIYLFAQGRTAAGIGMLIAAAVISVIDNILRPWLMKGHINLGFFWIFVSLIGGILTFGVAGIFVGPWILSLCIAAFRSRQLEDPKIAEQLDTIEP